jgi:hypothetical protein
MRINVYSQELITDDDAPQPDIDLIHKTSNTGLTYSAIQMFLHSSDRLHHPPADDDRSAISFWLPKSKSRREYMARQFERMASLIRKAPAETGLD